MQTVNTETIAGETIEESLGIARGNTVETRHLGRDFLQELRHVIGGELKDYTALLTKARQTALSRMERDARDMDADAVVNIRLETSEISIGGAEIIAYGTAVRLQ
jgi:uncharacterized protein YbjQ (UPF0145 family)